MDNQLNYAFAFRLYNAMLNEYTTRYRKKHGASKHWDALFYGANYIPNTTNFVTPHPQCFSGHDHCKTDEDWPIMAYRAFYKVDKIAFARYNKGRSMPEWML